MCSANATGVQSPRGFHQDEGMQLLAAERAVPANLSFEIDLPAIQPGTKENKVTRALEGIKPVQLLGEHLGLVELGQVLPDGSRQGRRRIDAEASRCRHDLVARITAQEHPSNAWQRG